MQSAPVLEASKYLWPIDFIGRIAVLIYYAATTATLFLLWNQYLKKAYRTAWFDVSKRGWLEKLSWNPDVKYLMTNDPLEHRSRFRLGWPFQILRDIVMTALAILIWFAGLLAIDFLKHHLNKDNIESTTFLIGFLGFAGTFGKVVYEWRLKARSENRQKWINDIRVILAELIQNMPSSKDNEDDKKKKIEVYLKHHGTLELLLNPSERDHRALLALIRHIYKFPNVPIDETPRKELNLSKLDPTADFDTLKSQMIRLSNVVLKREWERVKHIQ